MRTSKKHKAAAFSIGVAWGGYVFITWKSDHSPRHVHVYRDGKLVVKWDLDNKQAMKGTATRRVLVLIEQFESEGLL